MTEIELIEISCKQAQYVEPMVDAAAEEAGAEIARQVIDYFANSTRLA